MFPEITVQGYRGFASYRMGDLKTVNLLVGKNNSGKTSLLEAVHLLATDGNPHVLARIALQRGEEVAAGYDDRDEGDWPLPDISHFFHGHIIEPDHKIRLDGDQQRSLEISIRARETLAKEHQLRLFEREKYARPGRRRSNAVLAIQITSVIDDTSREQLLTAQSNGGFDVSNTVLAAGETQRLGVDPARFLGTESAGVDLLQELWDQSIEEGTEAGIVEALQILDERVSSIHFRVGQRRSRSGKCGIVIGFADQQRRVPLGSLGDGMRRLLALALALNHTRGGVLLVDEIDTGLHWTTMPDMWRLVIETARQNGTQVFATTHSSDCLKGLATACNLYPDLAELVSVQTIEPELGESIALPGARLPLMIEQEIEVR